MVLDSRDDQIANAAQERTHLWVEVQHPVTVSKPSPHPEHMCMCADANTRAEERLVVLWMRSNVF